MTRIQSLVSGTLRASALLLGGAAAGLLVQTRAPSEPAAAATDPAAIAHRLPVDAEDDRGETALAQPWHVQADGWHIRVGGADVDFPTVAEAFAGRPRTVPEVRLSPYDDVVRYYARKAGFDWRLIVAIIAAESGFDPRGLSHKGAYGLMQVRAIAARAVGEHAFHQPADNIRTGIRYLRKLEEHFPDAFGRDRLFLMLAAYNAGPGHISDARQLAREAGLDPNRWFGGVREVLPALENPNVYRGLKHGFARGRHTIDYVEGIWDQFLDYQRATAAGIFPGPDPRASSPGLAAQPLAHGVRG